MEEEFKEAAEKDLVEGKPEGCAVIKANRGQNFQKEKVSDLPSPKNHF